MFKVCLFCLYVCSFLTVTIMIINWSILYTTCCTHRVHRKQYIVSRGYKSCYWLTLKWFLCPLHKMDGAYSVTLFRHSVLPSFCQFSFIILVTVAHIQLKLNIWIYNEKIQVKFEFGRGLMIFDRVMPLSLWQ
jgi:hypothetical protein